MKYIWFEIKRSFRMKETIGIWILIVLLVGFSQFSAMQESQEQIFFPELEGMTVRDRQFFDYSQMNAEDVARMEQINSWGQTLESATPDLNDLLAYTSALSRLCSMTTPASSQIDYDADGQVIEEIITKHQLFDYRSLQDKYDLAASVAWYEMLPSLNQVVQYVDLLAIKQQTPLKRSEVTSGTAMIQFDRSTMALAVPLVLAFLFFQDRRSRDKEGSEQALMEIAGMKKRIGWQRLVAQIAVAMILVFSPFVVEQLVFGVIHGFSSWTYPMLVNAQSIQSFTSGLPLDGTVIETTTLGLTSISMDTLMHPQLLDFVDTWIVNGWIVFLFLFIIIWIVMLNTLISGLIKNMVAALLVRIGIVAVLLGIAFLIPKQWINVFNPLAYWNVVDILSGNLHYSLLAGVAVCIGWIVLTGVGIALVERKKLNSDKQN